MPELVPFNKITPELKKRWVEALRSGEYRQTRDALYSKGKFCCLGVLAHIQGVTKEELRDWAEDHFYSALRKEFPGDMEVKLADMNDAKLPFTNIADYIEDNLDV